MMIKRWIMLAIAALSLMASPQASHAQTRVTVDGGVVKTNNTPTNLIAYTVEGALAEAGFDYRTFFNTLLNYQGGARAKGPNMVRVWAVHHWSNSLLPFQGTRSSCNLQAPNADFYARLLAFVEAANNRGLIVQLTVLDADGVKDMPLRWINSPYKDSNNSQPYIASPGEFRSTTSLLWMQVHEPMLRKIVQTIGHMPNVIYEVENDGENDVAFQEAVVKVLRREMRGRTGSDVISVHAAAGIQSWALGFNGFTEGGVRYRGVDMISFHLATGQTPQASWNTLSKPVIVSNDGHKTQSRLNGYPQDGHQDWARANDVRALMNQTFNTGAVRGHNHFDVLDKDLYGSSWRTSDYNAQAANADRVLLSVLGVFSH